MSGSSYSPVPPFAMQSDMPPPPPYAPRPHTLQGIVAPPPKMDKNQFDRCGNCTRAFGFLSRKRHCANCGYVYCSDCCTEKVKLIKFSGFDSRDLRVCDYCKEFLKIDRMPSQILMKMSVRSLREYIDAYGIAKERPFVEKSDLIDTILSADITDRNEERIFRQSTPGFRDWYKRHSRNGTAPRVRSYTGSTAQSTTSSSNSTSIPTANGPSQSTLPIPVIPPVQFARSAEPAQPALPPRPASATPTQPPIIDAPETASTTVAEITARIERSRRPYVGSHEVPPVRPRSASAIPDGIEQLHLSLETEPAPFERRRRQYSISSRSSSEVPTPSQTQPRVRQPNSPPPTTLHEIVEQGVDISSLSTSTLLAIMRQNNCPVPVGAIEKDDLIERVEEMASFVIAQPVPNSPPSTAEKLPKVRDEDEDDCRICFDRVADYCLVPCGHTGFCFMCARKMVICPFCKIEVGHAQKLWKV